MMTTIKRQIRRMKFWGLMGALGLWGCSDDAENGGGGQQKRVIATVYAGQYSDVDGVGTRAWYNTYGYGPYADISGAFENLSDLSDNSIGVFFTQGNDKLSGLLQKYTPSGGGAPYWMTAINATAGNYNIYGYIPVTDISGANISAINASYGQGAVMTLSGLPAVTGNDYCVTVGVLKGDDADGPDVGNLGTFAYQMTAGSDNYMFLLFDHLYAALRLQFKVDASYAALRQIRLKKIEMAADGVGKVTCTVRLTPNNTGANPITSVEFAAESVSGPSNEVIYEAAGSSPGVPLTTGGSNFYAGFLPSYMDGVNTERITRFTLHTTYDVYDRKDNLVRERCEADNVINLPTGFSNFERGKIKTLTLTVNPTYLYVLSEPDLDNPTLIIE